MSTPCIFDNTTVTEFDPLVRDGVPPACGSDPLTDPRCEDPQFAAENPTICPNSSPLVSLSISPATGTIDVAGKYGYRAIAHYENGKEKDVTDDAAWNTGDAAIAAVFSPGLISGIGVGSTTVSASWGGLNAFATIDVVAQCIMDGLDVAVVISRAASMNLCDSGPTCSEGDPLTRLQKAKLAVKTMVENVLPTDQVAVVSFGGIVRNTGATVADATLESVLNADKVAVDGSIDAIESRSPCSNEDGDLLCASGIGSGLQLAVQELNGPRARGGAVQRVIILVTDGVENICSPDPVTVAAAAIADGVIIIAVAIDIPDVTFLDCDGNEVLSHAFILSLVSSGMAYFEDTEGMADILSRIRNIICSNGYGYNDYYYFIPDNHHYLDQLDYTGFINWNVVYCVDLVGRDLWVFPALAGSGAYVDLCGTTCRHPGGLISKELFTFAPGNYRLTISLAGNQRSDYSAKGGDRVKVLLSTATNPNDYAINETVTILNKNQLFTDYVFNFTIGSPCSGYLQINEIPFDSQYQNVTGAVLPVVVGALLNNVVLQNLDTGVIMLSDNFNNENPA